MDSQDSNGKENKIDDRMPDLDSQPLWIKAAALAVAIGAILALIALYLFRL